MPFQEPIRKKRSPFRLIFDLLLLILLGLAVVIIIADRYGPKVKVEGNEAIIELSAGDKPYYYQGEYDLGSSRNPDGILKIKGANTVVIMDGDHRFSWFALEGGAILKQKTKEEGGVGLKLRVIYTLKIDESSKIDFTGSGYPARSGASPNAIGKSGASEGSGGGGGASIVFMGEAPSRGGKGQGDNGGEGGNYSPQKDQPTFVYPGFFGSGGGLAYGQHKTTGSHGGGMLSIFSGKLINFGIIALNGEDGAQPEKDFAGNGGGSGGAFYGRIGQFENYGKISAIGGQGSKGKNDVSGGGGSGGVIIIYCWEAISNGKIIFNGSEPNGSDGAELTARGGGDLGIKEIVALKKVEFDQPPFRDVDTSPLIFQYLINQKTSEIISANKLGDNLPQDKITLVFGILGDDYAGNDPEEQDATLKITFSSPVSLVGLDDCTFADERCFALPYIDLFKKIDEGGKSITKTRSEIIKFASKEISELEWKIYDLEPGIVNYYWLSINLKSFNRSNLSCSAQIISLADEVSGSYRQEINILPDSLDKVWDIK